ncbi:MAG: AAA family ATPase [Acidimicrobiia bacterium]|nr:AAA family ATPase [Acidimicrobiia bacterium]
MSLQIRLLGGLLIESNGRTLPRIPSRPGRSLFAYLVLNRDRPIGRDQLTGLFWPDMSDTQARRRLSQALWQVQTLLTEAGLPAHHILTTPNTVRFNPSSDFWLDVAAFEGATASLKEVVEEPAAGRLGELTDAIALYRGDLLAGMYDDWITVEQERLRRLLFRALRHVAAIYKSRGEFDEALSFARRLALLDPLHEEAHRDVMRLCLLAGRPNDALLQYEVCYSALADELGAEPEPATTQLFESIAAQRRSGRRPFVPAPRSPLFDPGAVVELVGRDEPRTVAVDAIEGALAGRGTVLLFEGEAGVGKTRLLEAIAEDANWRGCGVLWGESVDGDAARSYHPLVTALSGALSPLRTEQLRAQIGDLWLGELARLMPQLADRLGELPGVAALEPLEEAERVREAIGRTIGGLARITPQLLVLDDFQWADEETVAAIGHLAGSIDGAPIVLCVAYRAQAAREHSAVWEALRQIDAGPRSRRLSVTPLARAETAELIRVSSDVQPDRATLDRIQNETGGNPLFVLETLRALHEHHVALADGPAADPGGDFPLPSTVQDLISRRLVALGAAERTVLEAYAVAGHEAEATIVAAAIDRPRPEFYASLDVLVARGILLDRGDRYRFRHELARRVVLAELTSDEIARLHEAVAGALLRHDSADDEAIVHHLEAAGRIDELAPFAVRAAQRAEGMRAYGTAAEHYRRAIDGGSRLADRIDVLFAYERVLDVLGERARQADVVAELLAAVGSTGSARAEALRRHAWHLAHTDRFTDAAAAVTEALGIDTAVGSDDGVCADLMVLGTIGLWSGETEAAVDHLRAASLRASTTVQQAQARRALGSALSAVQQYEQASLEAQAALALFGAAADLRGEAETLGLLGIITMERGRAGDAIEFYERAVELSRRIGYRHGEAVNTANRANALWYAGRIAESLRSFTNAIDLFRSIGHHRGEAMVHANAASLLHSVVGDDDTATAYCRSALEYFLEVGNADGAAQVRCNLADIARRAGDFDEAFSHLEHGLESVTTSGNRWLEVQLLYSQAQLELAIDQPGAAERIAVHGLELCAELGLADFESGLHSVVALARLARGDLGGALAAGAAAGGTLQRGSDQDYLITYRRGLVLEAAGRVGKADAAFAEAEERLLERIGDLTESERAMALATPEHRDIQAAAARRRSVVAVVRLARRDVPTGRPLRPDDMVDVAWTVASPGDDEIGTSAEVRRHRLRRLLAEADAQRAAATVNDLAEALDASVRTVRRDLQALRKQGIAVTTRGAREGASGPL